MEKNTADLPKTQLEAARAGNLLYFTGRPCKRGHLAARQTLSGDCIACAKHRAGRHKAKIKEALAAASASAE